jgi:hypothetical protein
VIDPRWGTVPVAKRMASANEVFPAPALEIKTTFLSDSLCSSLMGPSFSRMLKKPTNAMLCGA